MAIPMKTESEAKSQLRKSIASKDAAAKRMLFEVLQEEFAGQSFEDLSDEDFDYALERVLDKNPDEFSTGGADMDRPEHPDDAVEEPKSKAADVPPLQKRIHDKVAPGTRYGEDPTSSRPYSVARMIRACFDRDYAAKYAKVEMALSEDLEKLGYEPKGDGKLMPLDSAYLEYMHSEGGDEFEPGLSMKGLRQHMTGAYVPRGPMQAKLDWGRKCGIENLTVKGLMHRGLVSDQDDKGGFLLDTERSQDLIDILRPNLVLQQVGVTEVTLPQSGRLEIPTKTKGATAYRKREAQELTASDLGFGIHTMQAKELTALTITTQQLIRRASYDVEAIIREELMESLAQTSETQYFYAAGDTDTPRGLINWGIHVVTPENSLGGALTAGDIFELPTDIEQNNGMFNAWVMAPRGLTAVRRLRTGALDSNDDVDPTVGAFLFTQSSDVTSGAPGMLDGYPVFKTSKIKTDLGGGSETHIFGGDWSQVWIGRSPVISVSRSDEVKWLSNQVAIKAIMEDDLAVAHKDVIGYIDRFLP